MHKLVCSLVMFAVFTNPVEAATKPNVIVILTDDQGWGDLSLHGNTNLSTVAVDALGRGGARFDRFFVQPVCSPTRAEFLTGRWHPRGGVRGVSTGQERLNLDESTIADAFKKAGYATACLGKWHNGSQYPYHPKGRGFEEYYGFTSGHWGEYFNAALERNGQPVQGEGFLPDDLTQRTINFLKQNNTSNKPSFVYLTYNTPHSPMQVPQEYWDRFANKKLDKLGLKKEDVNHTRAALAMCENLSTNIGRILEALHTFKMEENTIIVYFHDNGPNGPRWNAGMKGHKGSTDEGGVRSPLFIRWPGKIKPGTLIEPIASAIDLYPTLIELADIPRAGQKPFDGVSFASLLLGQNQVMPDRVLFNHWAGRTSARNQRYRLDATGQLYDMKLDPGQTQNIAAANKAEAEKLANAVASWRKEVVGHLPKEDARPFPVGYPEFYRTVLPARDGVPLGNVKRSANAPNCSYFTNWTSTQDAMTWQIEVKTSGQYEAFLHYTCPEKQLGSTVELRFGQQAWKGVVSYAFDTPLRGQAEDRVPRVGESYVKDFNPMRLGVVRLDAGKGELKLQATKVAGQSVADIRAVELNLIISK